MIEIDIAKALLREGETFPFEYVGRPQFPQVEFAEDLCLKGQYTVLDGRVIIKGNFRTVVTLCCMRCLADVPFKVDHDFDETFYKTESGENREDDNYTYEGKTLSLDKMVYDATLLSIPTKVLCSDDCKGLCQVCGENLNEAQCGCETEEKNDSPFSGLKDLFKE